MQQIVIAGIDTKLGAGLAAAYRATGKDVAGIGVGDPVAELTADWIDVLIVADGFAAPAASAAALRRADFAPAFLHLTFAPFHLATSLRPKFAPGAKLVLLSRTSATMTAADPAGHYRERPFRAAAHALWRSLSVEWKPLGIDVVVLALEDASADPAQLLETIAAVDVPAGGCTLLAADGSPLPW